MDLYIKTSSKKKKRAKTEAWRQKKEKKSHPLILQLAGKLVFQLNALQFQENWINEINSLFLCGDNGACQGTRNYINL